MEKRYVGDVKSAFQHYLVSGKPGYVPHQWATLDDGLACIKAGGGIPVLAHPGRYKLTRTEMRKFLGEFNHGQSYENYFVGNCNCAWHPSVARMLPPCAT